jgi:hypothetical protein
LKVFFNGVGFNLIAQFNIHTNDIGIGMEDLLISWSSLSSSSPQYGKDNIIIEVRD